jgi:hypothetical protein
MYLPLNSIFILLILLANSCREPHHDIVQIQYETSSCEGTCPVFQMIINKDRTATYHAIHYNERDGLFKTKIYQPDYDKLIQLLKESNWHSLKSRYTTKWTDLPSCTLSIKYDNGSVKKVYDYGQRGTNELKDIYKFLFDFRENQDWK